MMECVGLGTVVYASAQIMNFPNHSRSLTVAFLLKHDLSRRKPEATVDRTLDTKVFKGWVETDNPWTSDDETDNAEMTYVNLQLNPERYTGYTGDSARRIWTLSTKKIAQNILQKICARRRRRFTS
ncbi:Endoplasmic oxidoreductin-2 [Hordeum vulgare]|nr:Endoplasmic oxidoreductin-2 [Hordeum vulgare]